MAALTNATPTARKWRNSDFIRTLSALRNGLFRARGSQRVEQAPAAALRSCMQSAAKPERLQVAISESLFLGKADLFTHG